MTRGPAVGALVLVLLLAACVHLHIERSGAAEGLDGTKSTPDVQSASRPADRTALNARLHRIRGELDGMCRAGELDTADCEVYRRRLLDLALAETEEEFAALGPALAADAAQAHHPTVRGVLLDLATWVRGRGRR